MKNDPNKRLEPENPTSSEKFFDVIFKRFNIDRSSPEAVIASQWNQIVGDNLSSISKFGSLKNGSLTVFCQNGSQATLIRMNKTEIIKNIKSLFPEVIINKLEVRISPNNSKTC